MMRIFSLTLGITAAMTLLRTGADVSVARAQVEFFDNASHVPPSPSQPPVAPLSPGYSFHPLRSVMATVGTPASAVTAAPQSTATKPPPFAYSPARPRNISQYQGRSTTHFVEPARAPTASRTYPANVSNAPAGRRPDYADPQWSRTVTPLGQIPANGPILQASANQFEDPASQFRQPFADQPAPLVTPYRPSVPTPPGMNFPSDRPVPPMILGSHLRLPPGETATERSLRLMSVIGEMEKHIDALGQQSAEQNQLLKQRDDQLLLAIREIKSARKEVTTARDELERLRQLVKALQDKVQDAERDNAALLQTLAPLIQKLLEPDAPGGPADESQER